ncbi:hypothetical protein FDP25_14315 [Roseovarius sp. A21]|uniref:Uncharacterized protein n=1 Tax=Roseovarius bejariae TaxID=2576383 RepID=A0A844CPS6_9RHOB|nr:hypothetical protein [Roseovarius bejariae]MRU16612.1 hypothetical protein [Roseovarius bejariae]
MTGLADHTGAAVVGRLTDLPPWEADLILSMRLWMQSPEGQAEVWNGFARCFGPVEGRAEMQQFESLLRNLCHNARRPLVRHALGCTCIGTDEAVLRMLVREAARGDLAEATMIASLLVPAGQAEQVALISARVGRAMQRMSRHMPQSTQRPAHSANRRLH